MEKLLELYVLVATSRNSLVATIVPARKRILLFKKSVTFVQQIAPAKDALIMAEVEEPFSWAFEQTCGLREVNELVLNNLTKS
jgi:hypothetical protein